MKTEALISTSLAMVLAATPSFAKKNNRDMLNGQIWNPDWITPTGHGIYYGSTKSPTSLTQFASTKIEFKSTDAPPPYGLLYRCD